MRYLELYFNDAKYFLEAGDDRISVNGEASVSRLENQPERFQEPITRYQISNMLHVLYGERPIPTFRENHFNGPNKPAYRIKHYDAMADNSYLLIENIKIDEDYMKEIIHTSKPAWNSHRKNVIIGWETVCKYLGGEVYEWFIHETSKYYKMSVTSITFIEFRRMFEETKSKEFKDTIISKLKEYRLFTFFSVLENENNLSYITANEITRVVNVRGITKTIKLYGKIYVPVTDGDIEVLRKKGKGTATLLDGGLVYISRLINGNELSIGDAILVSDINTKKTKYKR